jgi:hypothetical protein
MLIMLVPAAVLTLVTFLLAALWRGILAIAKRPAPGYWRRMLRAHGLLFVLHLFLTVPLVLGLLPSRFIGTRGDEQAYAGPRVSPDGTWHVQTREGLRAERRGAAAVDPALAESAAKTAVTLTAKDGVKLRGFLVPAAGNSAGEPPRFNAVLVHGLYRGGLEIDAPGSLFHDMGGQVLLLELRNHGGSERRPATYGLDESLDVAAAAEFLRAQPHGREVPLVVYAISLGTAAASLAAPTLEGLSGLVLEAPMDDLEATAVREIKRGGRREGIPQPWASTILWSARLFGGIPIGKVKPREALAKLPADVEVLLIGAGKDDRMPPDTVRAVYDTLPTPPGHKELWMVPEATHGKVLAQAPEEYKKKLEGLVERVRVRDQAAQAASAK